MIHRVRSGGKPWGLMDAASALTRCQKGLPKELLWEEKSMTPLGTSRRGRVGSWGTRIPTIGKGATQLHGDVANRLKNKRNDVDVMMPVQPHGP